MKNFVVANALGLGLLLTASVGISFIMFSVTVPPWWGGAFIGLSLSFLYLLGIYVGRVERTMKKPVAARDPIPKSFFEACKAISRYAYVGKGEYWKIHKSHVLHLEEHLREHGYDSNDPFGFRDRGRSDGKAT